MFQKVADVFGAAVIVHVLEWPDLLIDYYSGYALSSFRAGYE